MSHDPKNKRGEEVVKKAAKAIVKRAKRADSIVSEDFLIDGRELVLECPESVQKYSLLLEPKARSIEQGKTLRLESGEVQRASIKQLRGFASIPNTIAVDSGGITIDLSDLQSGEQYIVDIEYKINDPRFIDSLVDRHKLRETPSELMNEYWMVAQMKHLEALKESFNRIDIRNIDFGVDVGIHQDINLTVPSEFKQQIQSIISLLGKSGRSEKFRDFKRFQYLQRRKYGGRELELLAELQELFLPLSFSRFVEVEKQFYLHACERGTDFYDRLPIPTWPKYMRVVSRTSLNFEQPAADGILRYKKKDFLREVESKFA